MYIVYSMEGCASCVAAKQLLTRKGLDFKVIMIEDDPDAWAMLKSKGLRSMPQVFKDEELIDGGFIGLTKLLAT